MHSSSSAFAFVALWDPEKGIIVLSAVDTLDEHDDPVESPATDMVHFPKSSGSDTESLSFYQSALSLAESFRSSECYGALQSRHNTLFSGEAIPESQRRRGASQTSSTLGGLDVYLKGAALSTTHWHQPVYSFLNLNTDFQFPDDSEGSGAAAALTLGSTLDIERVSPSLVLPGHKPSDHSNVNTYHNQYLKHGPTDKQGDSSMPVLLEQEGEASNPKPRSGRRLQKKRRCLPVSSNMNTTTPLLCQRQSFHPWKLLRGLVCTQKPTLDECDWILIDTLEGK